MFDQSHILNQYLKKIQKEVSLKMSPESAFNDFLDRRLKKFVLLYHFNFEAIALHLIEEFPQFQYKLSKNSVAYRWFQLSVGEKYGDLSAFQNVSKLEKSQKIITQNKLPAGQTQKTNRHVDIKLPKKSIQISQSEQSDQSEELETNNKSITKSPQKANSANFTELEKALQQAQSRQIEQNEGFMIYKPKYENLFQRKLSKQQSQQSNQLSNLIQQQVHNNKFSQSRQSNNKQKQALDTHLQPGISQQDDYQFVNTYNYNYSRLEEEYNHYNHIISNYGFGYHEDSMTDSGSETDNEEELGQDYLLEQDQLQIKQNQTQKNSQEQENQADQEEDEVHFYIVKDLGQNSPNLQKEQNKLQQLQ